MEYPFQLFMILFSLGLLILVWQFTKRGLFRPAYALLWLLIALIFLIFSVFRGLVPILANFFQVSYPPSFLFAIGIAFITILQIHHTVLLSLFSIKNKELAQDNAILSWRVEQLENFQESLQGNCSEKNSPKTLDTDLV
jgi:hypothetical protein